MAERNPDCLLGKEKNVERCKKCGSCGWNRKVEKARNAEIAANGLTEGPDGIRRLIIRKGVESDGSDT